MSTCRKCPAQVLFVRSGKNPKQWLPLNAEPTPEGTIVIRDDGHGYVVAPMVDVDPFQLRYTSHFATCPQAATFRRKGTTDGKR